MFFSDLDDSHDLAEYGLRLFLAPRGYVTDGTIEKWECTPKIRRPHKDAGTLRPSTLNFLKSRSVPLRDSKISM